MMFQKRSVVFALLAAGCVSSVSSSAWAWDKSCDANRCATAVALANPESKTMLKVAVMQSKTDTGDVGLLMTAPLGAALEPGMRMIVGGQDLKLPFKVCFPDGCQAYMQVTADLLKTIKDAKQAQVQFFAQANTRALAVEVDMAGFAEAWSKPVR